MATHCVHVFAEDEHFIVTATVTIGLN